MRSRLPARLTGRMHAAPGRGWRQMFRAPLGMQSLFDAAAGYVNALSPAEMVWIAVGFGGQFLFMMRFLWQWIQSERQRRSIIPIAFWYFSLAGGMTLFVYAVHRRDPVFITGQMLGLVVYTRNLLLIRRERRAALPPA
jgi:lipid-A-disaccharide synthase-like uncharacterized protein